MQRYRFSAIVLAGCLALTACKDVAPVGPVDVPSGGPAIAVPGEPQRSLVERLTADQAFCLNPYDDDHLRNSPEYDQWLGEHLGLARVQAQTVRYCDAVPTTAQTEGTASLLLTVYDDQTDRDTAVRNWEPYYTGSSFLPVYWSGSNGDEHWVLWVLGYLDDPMIAEITAHIGTECAPASADAWDCAGETGQPTTSPEPEDDVDFTLPDDPEDWVGGIDDLLHEHDGDREVDLAATRSVLAALVALYPEDRDDPRGTFRDVRQVPEALSANTIGCMTDAIVELAGKTVNAEEITGDTEEFIEGVNDAIGLGSNLIRHPAADLVGQVAQEVVETFGDLVGDVAWFGMEVAVKHFMYSVAGCGVDLPRS